MDFDFLFCRFEITGHESSIREGHLQQNHPRDAPPSFGRPGPSTNGRASSVALRRPSTTRSSARARASKKKLTGKIPARRHFRRRSRRRSRRLVRTSPETSRFPRAAPPPFASERPRAMPPATFRATVSIPRTVRRGGISSSVSSVSSSISPDRPRVAHSRSTD